MFSIAKPSYRSLYIEMRFNGQTLSNGTAFVVNTPTKGPHLVTNRHNVTGRNQTTGKCLSETLAIPNEILISHNRKGALGQVVQQLEVLLLDDLPQWVEHPTLGDKADFVAIALKELDDVDIYTYDPGNPGDQFHVGPADAVSVIGFPFGVTAAGLAVWATGFLASEPAINYANLPIQLIDCRTREGQSGSPVVAYRAGGALQTAPGVSTIFDGPVERFIGIYSGRINAESDLGMVWKASAIAELIQTL